MAASSSIFFGSFNESRWSSRFDDGSNPEEELCRIFKAAERSGSRSDQLSSLKGLAQLLIDKESWIEAAYLLNGALALTEDRSERALLLGHLEEIEHRSCSTRLWLQPEGRLTHHREELESARKEAATLFESGAPPEEVQYLLTDRYQRLLVTLIEEAIAQIGPPPKGFAVMTLGSMARREVSPYSDVEFAFLVRNPSDSAYFKELTKLLHLKMINMGESADAQNGFGRINGFRMDAKLQLIGTPQELADMQKEEWLSRNSGEITTVNALTTVSFLMGDQETVDAYQQAIDYILDQRSGFFSWFSSEPRLRERRAHALIEGHLVEFQPRLDQEKISLRAFNVKQELYRLPQATIAALALYYKVKGNNTLELIDLLRVQGVFGEEGANRLKEAFRSILALRIQTHLFYKTECEILYHARGEDDETADGLLCTTPALTDKIREIYCTLIPFQQRAEAFLREDLDAFTSSSFYDLSIGTYDDSLRENLQFNAAIRLAQSATALSPTTLAYKNLGNIQFDMGRLKQSTESFKESLLLLKEKHGDLPHPDIADILSNLGVAYRHLGNLQSAKKHHERALRMRRSIYGDSPNRDVAASLTNLANTYDSLDDYHQAIKYHKESLEISNKIPNCPRLDIAISLTGIGNAYTSLGNYRKSIKYHKKSLNLKKKIYGNQPHPSIAESLMNLGTAQVALWEIPQGIKKIKASIKMKKSIYGNIIHPSLANSLNNLGNAYLKLKKYDLSIKWFKRSLTMRKSIYGDHPHLDIATSLMNLGNAYLGLGEADQAIKMHKDSLKIKYALYSDRVQPDVADSLSNLGFAYRHLGKNDRAICFFDRSLSMFKLLYDDGPHPRIADTLSNLGFAHHDSGDYNKATYYFNESLKIIRDINVEDHFSTGMNLAGLGRAYSALGNYSEAIQHLKQAYEEFLKTADEEYLQMVEEELKAAIAAQSLISTSASSSSSSSSFPPTS